MAQEVVIDIKTKGGKEAKESVEQLGGSIDKLTGGALSSFQAIRGSLAKVVTGFKTLRGAIAATGIGALVIAIASLKAAFTSSEEGQNRFNKIMTVTGALVGNLVDLLADLGEKIIDVFTNPIESLKSFGNAIVKFIKNPIEGVTDAYNAATKAVNNFVKEQKEELSAAQEVADMRAKADKIERDLLVERSKLEAEIAELRLKARQEDQFTAAERRQALLDAQDLEDELLKKETEYLELRRDAQVLENTFSRSNKENLDKEANAIAAVNRQTAQRLNLQRQTQRELNRLNNELEREQDLLAKAKEQDAATRITEAVDEEKMRSIAVNQQVLKNAQEQIKIEEDAAKKRREIAQQDLDFKIQNTTNGLNAILALNSIFQGKTTEQQKKAFKRTKALNIAATLTETYLSAQKAYTSQIIPLDPTSVVRGVLAAAASVAAGLARVAQIRRTNFSPSSEGSTPSIGGNIGSGNFTGGSGFNPLTPTVTTPTPIQDVNVVNAQSGVRAYVVENDITNSQALTKTLNRRSRL